MRPEVTARRMRSVRKRRPGSAGWSGDGAPDLLTVANLLGGLAAQRKWDARWDIQI